MTMKRIGISTIRLHILVCLLCLAAQIMMPVSAKAQNVSWLDQFKWNNRLVVVFAPDRSDPVYFEQIVELSRDKAGMKERDIEFISVFEDGQVLLGKDIVDPDVVRSSELRNAFSVFSGFQVFLIGKDGSIKRRSSKPVTSQSLFSVIDAMPMRRYEIKKEERRKMEAEW